MIQTKRIDELDRLRNDAFSAPSRLLHSLEERDQRGEAWWVLRATREGRSEATWLVVYPNTEEAFLFLEDGPIPGRWAPEHELFSPEEGPSVNLMGDPTSLSELEDEAVDEDEWRSGWKSPEDRKSVV